MVVLGTLVLWLAEVVVFGLIAGLLIRQLDMYTLTSLSVLAIVGVLLFLRRRGTDLAVELRPIAGQLLRYCRRAFGSPLILILVLAVLAEYGWQAIEIVRLPIVSYDSVSYHLIGPATWLQHHAIVQSDQSIFADTYPSDQGVLVAWLGAYLHTMRYSPFVNFAFVLLGACAGYVLSRLLGVRPRYSAVAALAFMTLPPIFLESSTAYVDIAAGTTVVVALIFVIYAWHGKRGSSGSAPGLLGYLLLSGCALGLAVGVKSDNLVIIAPVAIAATTQYLRGTTDGSGPKLRVAAPLLIVPVVALGAFWYLRSWITWKNPFYPIDLLGFHGYGTVQQLIIGNNVPPNIRSAPVGYLGQLVVSWFTDLQHHPYYYDSRPGGFGLQWVFILAPALIYLLVYTFRHRWEFFWFLELPVIILLVLTQEPWMARYSMALFILAAAGFALILERLQGRRAVRYANRALLGAFVGLTIVTLVWANTPTVYSMNVNGYPTYLSFAKLARIAIKGQANREIQPWPQYKVVESLPAGSSIGFSGLDSPMFTYPLVGQNLARQLVRLPYNGTSARGLAQSLRQVGTRYLVLGLTAGDQVLFQRVEADLSQFRPLSEGDTINGQNLYEVGSWKACEGTNFALIRAVRHSRELIVTARLVSSCGPEAFLPVTLMMGNQGSPLYSSHNRKLQESHTNRSGIVTFTIPDAGFLSRYFIRQEGGYISRTLYAPAATAPFTYSFVPLRG